ncbi:Plant UBX domain-containing protein [Vigna angularis]|uniref:Plant UBX domain-containing protein n=1 Tax=Phaseolus angularis TaxID=3914 RepID=A0A8T0KBU5_PHAAN|nr:Plant UBX domain-containing protein [Vigna angularis]
MASRDNKKASSSQAGRIRTLADLNRPSTDSDSDSDGPQEYYTGGEKSGMLVQDPSKGNDVDAIFNQARQLGAVERPLDQLQEPQRSTSFAGTGRLLSGETAQSTNNQQPESVVHNIVFWSNGFTVNDGPLRRLDDPENASFLECFSSILCTSGLSALMPIDSNQPKVEEIKEIHVLLFTLSKHYRGEEPLTSIKKSECPKELEPADRRSSVNVNLIRRNENYPEPVKQHVPFQGVGRTLGSSSTSVPTASSTPPTTAPSPSAGLVVDQSLPSTSIQVRVLTDETQTIEQAGLANSVVIQKF